MYMRAVSNTGCMPCDWASATAAECTCGTSSCTRLLAGIDAIKARSKRSAMSALSANKGHSLKQLRHARMTP